MRSGIPFSVLLFFHPSAFILHPSFFWLLLPWAGLVVLVLRAHRPRVVVPFLDLWPRDVPRDDRRRAWRLPPAPLILLLAAMLIAIGALADPAWRSAKPRLASVTVVVDRGVTMLTGNRLRAAGDAAISALMPLLETQSQIRIMDSQGRDDIVGPAHLREALGAPATAEDVHAKMAGLVQKALSQTQGPVLLISDTTNYEPSDRLIVCRPAGPTDNVGIRSATLLAEKCVITLHNDSPRREVTVFLRQGGKQMNVAAKLAGKGEQSVCVIPGAGHEMAVVSISDTDDLPDDNIAWVMPEHEAARLQIRGELPESVRQFTTSYTKARSAGADAPAVLVTSETTSAHREIIIAPGGDSATLPEFGMMPDHPILRNVVMPKRARVSASPLPAGDWQILLAAGEQPLLAVSKPNNGKTWIGFTPADGESPADYVVLLTNCVQWCAGGASSSRPPHQLSPDWRRIGPEAPLAATENGLRAGLYELQDERMYDTTGDKKHLATRPWIQIHGRDQRDDAVRHKLFPETSGAFPVPETSPDVSRTRSEQMAINVPSPLLNEFTNDGRPGDALERFADRESRVALAQWLWLVALGLMAVSAAAIGRPSSPRIRA